MRGKVVFGVSVHADVILMNIQDDLNKTSFNDSGTPRRPGVIRSCDFTENNIKIARLPTENESTQPYYPKKFAKIRRNPTMGKPIENNLSEIGR